MNTPESLLRLLALKGVQRKGWTRFSIPDAAVESVADHSYGVALMVLLLCPSELDRARAVEIALLHDLAEVVTGDVIPSEGVPEFKKAADELGALLCLTAPLDWETRASELLREYQSQSSPEARFVKAVDKLDMALQSLAYQEEFKVDLSEFRDSARETLIRSGLLHWIGEETVVASDEAPE